ncbi:MAG TPA: energy transducer TonB [Draconibacterium sp.]|nr:energy transducer TonB [Draconibacterium sp.]
MKTKIIFAISMLVAAFAFGQNQDLQEIKVTAPQFRSDIYKNINDFLLSGIEYPVESLKAGEEGTEVIQFVVTPKGNVTDIAVINSVSEIIDLEVKRILEITSGMWIPGTVNSEPVAMEKEISVVFKISQKSDFVAKAKGYLEHGNKLLFVHNRPEKALKYFDKGVTLLPNEETLLALRGLCKYEIGDNEGAKLDWNRFKILTDKNSAKSLIESTVNYTQLSGYNEMMTIVDK